MKKEILLHHEATAIAAKNGCAGLYELAQHRHVESAIQRGDLDLNRSHVPTVTRGFYYNQACGECGVIFATMGASHEEDGLEGVRFLFGAHEAAVVSRPRFRSMPWLRRTGQDADELP